MIFIIMAAVLVAMVILAVAVFLILKLRSSWKASRNSTSSAKRVIVIPVSPRPFPDEYGARNRHDLVEQQVNINRPQEFIL